MFEVNVIAKTSKSGNQYICLEVVFPNGYKKLVFLDKAEEFLAMEYIN